jgi:flagellar motor protein MotB
MRLLLRPIAIGCVPLRSRSRSILTQRYHVDASKLTASGFGAWRPQEANTTPEGRARNRRVELVRQ